MNKAKYKVAKTSISKGPIAKYFILKILKFTIRRRMGNQLNTYNNITGNKIP